MLSRLAYSFFAVFMLATVLFQDTAVAMKKNLAVIPYRTYCEKKDDGSFRSRVEVLLHKDLQDLGCSSSTVMDLTHVASNLKGHMVDEWERDHKIWGRSCFNQPCEVIICGVKYIVLLVRIKGDTAEDFCKFKKCFEDEDMQADDFKWFNLSEALVDNNASLGSKCKHDDYDNDEGFNPLGSGELEGDDAILNTKCVQDKLCDLAAAHGLNSPCCQPFFLKDRDPVNILVDLLSKLADPRLHPKEFSFTGPVKLCCDSECVTLSGTVAPIKDIRLVCGIFTVDLDKDFICCWLTKVAPQLAILSSTEPNGTDNNRCSVSMPIGDIKSQIKDAVSHGNLWLTCKSSDAIVDDEDNPVGVKICYTVHIGVTDKDTGDRTQGTWTCDEKDCFEFDEDKAIECCKFCLTLKKENAGVL